MKLTIFSRLAIGYSIILLLVVVANIYSMYQLRNVNTVTRSILEIDNRLLDLQKKLTDSLFAQIRYEKKCIVMRDYTLYDRFLSAKADFDSDLKEAFEITGSPRVRNLLEEIDRFHYRYQALVTEQVEKMKAKRAYNAKRFENNKEEFINRAIDGLKEVGEYSRQNTFEKIKQLDVAVTSSRSVAFAMISFTLITGILIAVWITRDITKPLAIMKKKTQDIAGGNFDVSINLSSPPEIGALADAFNAMCTRLKEVDRMKSNFLSIMSHELRTPLTSIQEGSNLLLEGVAGKITEKQRRLLDIIAEEGRRLNDLVDAILDLSKMEAGMMTYSFTSGDLTPLIERAILEIEPMAQGKSIRFEKKLEATVPVLKIDPERIGQVLRNLMGNAIQFTPEGGQVVVSSSMNGRWVEVSVSDTGPGIPREDLDRIFEKYRQVKLPDSSQKRGTGLGLAIVKHIIIAHGGKVWAESEPEKGSSFIFALPVR